MADIQHIAVFNLKHAHGSAEEAKFLADGRRILSAIGVVRDFRVMRQTSMKTDYDYAFSMVFASPEDYAAYNNHPDHRAFVAQRWDTEVSAFMEIDFEAM